MNRVNLFIRKQSLNLAIFAFDYIENRLIQGLYDKVGLSNYPISELRIHFDCNDGLSYEG